MVIAILLLGHPLEPHARLWHLNRPMILVSYSFVQPSVSSFSWKSKCRSSSSSRRDTSSCNAEYIDHLRSDFGFLDGMTSMMKR